MPKLKKEFPLIQVHPSEGRLSPEFDHKLIKLALYKAIEQTPTNLTATYTHPEILHHIFNQVFDYLISRFDDAFLSQVEPKEIIIAREKEAAIKYVKENEEVLFTAFMVEMMLLAIAHSGAIAGEQMGESQEYVRWLSPHSDLISEISKDINIMRQKAISTMGSGGNHRTKVLSQRFIPGQFASLVDERKPLVQEIIDTFEKYKSPNKPNRWIEELNKSSQFKDLSKGRSADAIEHIKQLIIERRSTRNLAGRNPNYKTRSSQALACDFVAYEFDLKKTDGKDAGKYFDTGTLLNHYNKDKKFN